MDEETYNNLTDMFESAGWKFFAKGTSELAEALVQAAPEGALTNDQWQYARGQIQQLRSVVHYEDYIKAGYAEQEEQSQAVEEYDVATVI